MISREEVAKKLRENSTAHTTDEAFQIICKCAIRAARCSKSVMEVLADLIDPTCHLVEVDNDGKASYVCSSCGNFGSEEVQLLDSFNFCPACGARVVRDEA